jgi:hypothetical protein
MHAQDLPDDGLDSAMPFRISNYPGGVFEPSERASQPADRDDSHR